MKLQAVTIALCSRKAAEQPGRDCLRTHVRLQAVTVALYSRKAAKQPSRDCLRTPVRRGRLRAGAVT